MSEPPAHPPKADELSDLFSQFLDQRLDEAGHHRLEERLREDPAAREHCAQRLLFEADLKEALEPSELEWLETRRVVLGKKDGRPSMRIQRSQEFRLGPRDPSVRPVPRKRLGLAVAAALTAVVIATAILLPRFSQRPAAPVLRNASFETTDLSLNTTGSTYALIDWQDYFHTQDADLCEIARVTQGRVFAKSGRNVARMKQGGYLTQRLHDENGSPIIALPGARYVLTGWFHTEGTATPLLCIALRVVASGWPAMTQYEAAYQQLELTPQSGWQPFRIELDLSDDLEQAPRYSTIEQHPLLDLKGREMTLSLDSRGEKGSVFYLDDVSLDLNPARGSSER